MLNKLSLTEAQAGLRGGQFSSTELVKSCLTRIQNLNPQLNAYLAINPHAEAEANKADVALPLGGIPLAIKDNFMTQGIASTASSKVLDNFLPTFDATVVSLLKKAGAIIIGKTNMDAWAHGSSTETSDYGPTKNPWNIDYLPGGSSGGSAAAVAADMCTAAIGSETAGSIRQPSAWCGVVGFKPTYGRVSRYGIVAMASSTDSPGPITKTVADAALLTKIISGQDPYDATTSPTPVPDYLPADLSLHGLKLGLPREYMAAIQSDAKPILDLSLKVLAKLGAEIVDISLIDPKYSIGVYTVVQRSEVSSNLARFDGVRYGQNRGFFGREAKRRIMLGTYSLSSGYYDQYYAKAQKVRSLIIKDFQAAFTKVDAIICPPSPGPALKLGASANDPMFGERQDMLVEPSSIAGLPGISIPCGFVGALPLGVGFISPQFSESLLFKIAAAFEAATTWHNDRPSFS
jgi:aspartyl-tRNA(Asn)/glutamyl-tRNA(Gln) amidotransferase subunit A